MAKTHYFPSDQVHFTWDAGNAPVLDRRQRRHRRRPHPRRQRRPDRAGLHARRHRRAGLGPRLPAGRADRRRRRRARRHAGHRGPRPPHPGLGLDRDPARARAAARRLPRCRTCGSSTSPTATSTTSARTSRSRSSRSSGTMGVCPAGASAQPVMPPGTFGGNMDTRQLTRGHDAVPARPGRRRALQLRRRARRPGRRRGLRDRPRVADVRRAALHAAQGPPDPRAAVPAPAGPLAPRVADGALVRDDRRRPRPVRRRPGGGARDGRPPRGRPTASRREDAYLLCSLCVDLRISEIVDAGEYVVSALLPLAIFADA